MDNTYFWGRIINRQNIEELCITPNQDETLEMRECVLHKDIISCSQNFELRSDFTLRLYKTQLCLFAYIIAASIKPCSNSSPTWGVRFQTTQSMHINTNYLGNCNAQIQLGNCNKNSKQIR